MKGKFIGEFSSNNCIIDLQEVRVLGDAIIDVVKPTEIYYSLDNVRYFKSQVKIKNNEFSFNNLVARYIKLDYNFKIKIYQGSGYIGQSNKKWDKIFVQDQYWVGGDGLFSFNLTGKDNYSSKEDDLTLCVFGDTFACTLSDDFVRLDPLAMPNNSYCEISSTNPDKANAIYHISEDEMGHCKAYLEPNNPLAFEGTMASNLVNYDSNYKDKNYLSGINPKKKIEIEFEFNQSYQIDYIEIFNYFVDSEKDYRYQNRGVKEFDLYLDDKFIKKVELEKASYLIKGANSTKVNISSRCKKVRFVIDNQIGVGNYLGANNNEAFFGLNKVYFYKEDKTYLKDIKVTANSEFLKKDKHSWFWLQDGIILNNKLYSLPYVVISDLTQPEGFQFRVEGISFVEIDIKDNKINFDKTNQKPTYLYKTTKDKTISFGSGFYNNSFNSNEKDPDGYIYIYGYLSSKNNIEEGNQLIVSRVKEENFTNLDEWKFFNGKEFVDDIEQVSPLVSHVSCELSLHRDGDKYIVVFTYDTQSRYIAYALGSTPYGPFEETRIAYVCPDNYCPHMYLYNAKAHPHLSKEGNILVSYNINTSNFEENIKFGRTYGPRFIDLKRIGGDNNEN